MLTSKAKFSANAATTFGLATTVAALWMTAVPFAGAAAAGPPGYPISAERTKAGSDSWPGPGRASRSVASGDAPRLENIGTGTRP